jgi:hypothetical protein
MCRAHACERVRKAGCIFEAFWEEPVLIQPSGIGGTNWAPMSYNPETGSFYVSGTIRTSAFARYGDTYKLGLRYVGGTQAAPIGSPMSGTLTAIGGNTNKIVWQHKTPYRVGQGGGSTTTAGGLVFRGEPDGNFLAINAKTGEELWRFQTGFGADAPPAVYELDGEEGARAGRSIAMTACAAKFCNSAICLSRIQVVKGKTKLTWNPDSGVTEADFMEWAKPTDSLALNPVGSACRKTSFSASWRAKSCETPFSPFGVQRETSAIMYQLCPGGAFLATREPTSFPARRAPGRGRR